MIKFKNITKQFGDLAALKDISFKIKPGELVFLTGKSGSGKTTLMKLLTKEYEPTSGEIEFNGNWLQKIKNSTVHKHRRNIGVVFQDFKLIPDLNVWENIALPLSIANKPTHEIEQRVTDLLNLVQLPEKAHLFPGQLSGGEAQRIGIARALAGAPKLIFADEPTGNLDKDNSLSVAHLLDKINQLGTTIIFATHDPIVLDKFKKHRRLTLNLGELIEDTENKIAKTKEKIEDKIEETSQVVEEVVAEKSKEIKKELDTNKEEAKSRRKSGLFGWLHKKNDQTTKPQEKDKEKDESKNKSKKSSKNSKKTKPTEDKS